MEAKSSKVEGETEGAETDAAAEVKADDAQRDLPDVDNTSAPEPGIFCGCIDTRALKLSS